MKTPTMSAVIILPEKIEQFFQKSAHQHSLKSMEPTIESSAQNSPIAVKLGQDARFCKKKDEYNSN